MSAISEGYNYEIFISCRHEDNKHDGQEINGNRYSVIGNQYTQQRATSTWYLKNGNRYSVIGTPSNEQPATST